jgi:CopG family nickel-responsive transcriptional regulator
MSYVFDHRDQTVAARLLDAQHEHHDLVVSSLHTHLDHDHCLENVVLRVSTDAVREFAAAAIALHGGRHGNLSVGSPGRAVRHPHARGSAHVNLKPVN